MSTKFLLTLSMIFAAPSAAQVAGDPVKDRFVTVDSPPAIYRGSGANVSTLAASTSIRRAGQWGRCVVTRDRAAGVAFIAASRDKAIKLRQRAALASTFSACRRQTGDFALRDRVSIQQAAIRDALRTS